MFEIFYRITKNLVTRMDSGLQYKPGYQYKTAHIFKLILIPEMPLSSAKKTEQVRKFKKNGLKQAENQ